MRSLEIAFYYEPPVFRRYFVSVILGSSVEPKSSRVCRPEIYRVKRTIYHTLVQRTTALETLLNDTPDSTFDSVNPLCKDVVRLIDLLDDVLEQEYSSQYHELRQVTNYFSPGRHGNARDFVVQISFCPLLGATRVPFEMALGTRFISTLLVSSRVGCASVGVWNRYKLAASGTFFKVATVSCTNFATFAKPSSTRKNLGCFLTSK